MNILKFSPYFLLSDQLSAMNRTIRRYEDLKKEATSIGLETSFYQTVIDEQIVKRNNIMTEINRRADMIEDQKVATDMHIKGFFAEP